jgi:hypothetical protein
MAHLNFDGQRITDDSVRVRLAQVRFEVRPLGQKLKGLLSVFERQHFAVVQFLRESPDGNSVAFDALDARTAESSLKPLRFLCGLPLAQWSTLQIQDESRRC